MTGTLAALHASGGATKIIQSAPLVIVYFVTVAAVIFGAVRLKGNFWHRALPILALFLGMFITAALPKASSAVAHLSSAGDRVVVDGVMVVLFLAAIIMSFVENRK